MNWTTVFDEWNYKHKRVIGKMTTKQIIKSVKRRVNALSK